ncbi:molybdate ABC transporter substrate-binding protein [Cohnella yongneupensis]|uniref:Molybdate ABC transporter substrate-binding protein n=1 Tax=Cohnella yongneupensis TaxID=425006 RepID=A0ABW0QXH8_9BACL
MNSRMKNRFWITLLVVALTFALTGCGKDNETVKLTVSAAASLTDALTEIQKQYEASHDRVKIKFNFAASGTLQQQIEQGAPVDLFISAAAKNMNALVDKQLIAEDEHTNLLSNSLVVVTPVDSKITIANMADLSQDGVKQIAIGIPSSVPAGNYAQQALTKAGLWEAMQSKTVQAKDVRQVLQDVETGNVDAGFVYKTDALTSKKSNIAFSVDPASYDSIVYPIGIVKATKYSDEAKDLYAYLQSKEAMDIFLKYGFELPTK